MLRLCQKMWGIIIAIIFSLELCFVLLILVEFSQSSSEFCDVYYQPDFTTISCVKHHKNHLPTMSGVKILKTACDLDFQSGSFNSSEWSLQFINRVNFGNCSLTTGSFTSLNWSNAELFASKGNKWDARLVNDTFSGLCGFKRMYFNQGIIKTIEPLAFRCLHQIVRLDLHENEIEFLPADVFKKMMHLKVLDISGNKINVLLQGLFDGLVSLNVLRLSSNSISHLPEDIFRQLSTLESLELSKNVLKYLNRSVLSSLTKLITLNLHRNRLERLTDSFSGNRNLRYLNINDNEGVYLNNETIAGLYDLRELEMSKCKLTSLPVGFFSRSHTISSLNLKYNKISEITPGFFGPLREILSLQLSFNDVTALKNQPFKYNRFLAIISLHKNKLSVIDGSYFKNLPFLEELDLSYNNISNLAYNSFHSLPRLDSLNLSHNIFSSLAPQLFRYNTRLSVVDFSYNRLTGISDANWNSRHAFTWFSATDNLITELNISLMPQSFEVHLERNKVRRIYSDSNASLHSKMKISIYLSGNPLDCDCQTYGFHKAMQERSLQNISFSDDLICQMPPLLTGRNIDTLRPDEFICSIADYCPRECVCFRRAYDNIQVVNCSTRGYVELPNKVPLNTNLLDVRQNNITSLKRLNEPAWKYLAVLLIENNSITSEEFYLPRNLKFLGLKYNKLLTLSETVQKHAKDVKDFNMSLSNNPWPCDCSSLPFKKFILEYMTQIVDANEIRCIFPNGSWSASSLTTTDDYDLCSSYLGTLAVYSVSASVVMIMSSLVVFYYRHKYHILSLLYIQCSRWYLMLCCFNLDSEEKQFDCFISYSAADSDVAYAILEALESNPPHFNFCIHERNWMPGQFITNNIIQSVQNSRKTIIILSETFTKSEWFRLEFQAAYHQMLRDRKDRLIIVLEGDLPDKRELDKDVQRAITWRTYLRFGERWFWEKLRRAIWEQSDMTKERSRDEHRVHNV